MIEARRKTCKCGAIMEISLNIQEGKLLSSVFGNCFPVGDFCWNLARAFYDGGFIWQVRCSICKGVRQVRTFQP